MADTDIPAELFEPLPEEDKLTDVINRPSISYWQNAYMKMKADKLAVVGIIFIIFMILVAIFVPILSPYTYDGQDYNAIYQSPCAEHPLGTDMFGRDLLVRVAYGARISLTIGIVTALVSLVVGVLFGGISGFFGGKVDMLMMRFVDVFSAVPSLLYSILLIMFMGPKMSSILIAICLTYWLSPARQTRGQILSVKNQDFATAAKVVGESKVQILLRHLVPNSMGPIIVTVMLLIPSAIFEEAFLSFIGIGIAVPVASWGTLANDGMATMGMYPYLMLFPALAISLTMFALNFIGDGLRDALDPRLKK
ncbi:MAG: ABC transporter permease [Emergencia sp.]|uniref:ABC transporter permease n=2 Tax=Bacillota TaxID=1239 RepID=A0A845QKC0_9FIRM|nr:ABC transporter permease [Emergencia sp.]NBH60548.1 ABC transporter permease [Anaerotruncus colihominis]NCF01202.1 ABC transporter permease [Anaerotruncus sp. 80]